MYLDERVDMHPMRCRIILRCLMLCNMVQHGATLCNILQPWWKLIVEQRRIGHFTGSDDGQFDGDNDPFDGDNDPVDDNDGTTIDPSV